jgi:capsular polysaccharide biosynthesis protein
MDDIRGVVLTDVDLPRDPAPDPQSRTVQPEIHPTFVRHYTPPTYPLRVAQIPGGHLIGSGAVLTADGKLVFESLWNQEHLQRYFQPPPKFPEAVHIDGACASLISLWDDNFFHWMFNSLPRLAVLAASGVEYDRLLVPAELKPFQRATLEMIGVDLEKLVPFTGRHVQADLLIWVAPLAPLNEPSSFLLEWVKRSLGQADETPERLLYVSRKGGTRKAANEREIFAVLERLGFEFVLPEQLSFPDQVRLFAQTRLAVGPHGSNFVNGIFSRELTVLEFFQPAHVNWGVYSVLCAAGQDHWSILCEPVRSLTRTRHRRFDDMKVPLDLVMESLDRIASEQGLSLS